MFGTAVLNEQASDIFTHFFAYLIYHMLFKVRNAINTKCFLLLFEYMYFLQDFECCVFSCVMGYILYFLNTDINHFIPSIVLNFMF
jgi:hypothetical protein